MSFLFSGKYETGDRPWALVASYLNDDDILDLAVANFSDDISVLIGLGDGSFAAAQTYNLDGRPADIRILDVNGDAAPDIVTLQVTGGIRLFSNMGDGTFQVATSIPAGTSGRALDVGMIDSGSTSDLVTIGDSDFHTMLGNGDGTFDSISSAEGGYHIALADFGNSGGADLAVTRGHQLEVYLGNGDGTFTPEDAFQLPGIHGHVLVGDLNNDALLDLTVVVGYGLNVFLNQGAGAFSPGFRVGIEDGWGFNFFYAEKAALLDADCDGDIDITVLRANIDFAVLPGNGDGSFSEGLHVIAEDVGKPWAVHVGDFNGDGLPDLAFGLANEPGQEIGSAVAIYLNTSQ
jgi:hypothetical protein